MSDGSRRYELVALALEAPPERRRAVVEGGCGGDTALRDEVLRILALREGIGGFLETPAPARLDLLAPAPPLPPGAEVGRYRIVRAVGSGGSGTVYEALQESPHRRVALKVMNSGSTGERFREEAEILARMSHPGVAHVYESGAHEGLPWIAMEYVLGRDVVAHAAGLPARERLELMARVCDAVHHGHEHGILHGDLKPSNLLVGQDGQPKVIDFGIARALGSDADGVVAGTPPYMSPEQCRGGRLDVRSDVYALGAVLYEIVAGRRPHEVSGLPLAEALAAMREEPVPLGRGADVDAIVAKAMARDRAARYASAAALADDLRRHLAYRPVEAHRGGAARHLLLFARRQPVAFGAVLAVLLVSMAAAAVSGRFALVSERQRAEAEYQAYVANLAAASSALKRKDPAEARQRLERAPEALRGWEWRYLVHGLDGSDRTFAWPGTGIAVGAASEDGSRIVCSVWATPPFVRIVRADTGETVQEIPTDDRRVDGVAIRGELVALGFQDGGIEIRGAERVVLPRHTGEARAVDFDRSGTRLVSGAYDGVVRVSDVATGRALVEFRGHRGRVFTARFDPTGTRVCSGDDQGFARIWRAEDGVEERVLPCGKSNVEGVAWSPDGQRIVTGSFDGLVRLWDAEQAVVLWQERHDAAVKSVAFAPDGLAFASAGLDSCVRVWRTADGSALSSLVGHAGWIYGIAFLGPDRVASFSMDGAVKVWDGLTRPDGLAHRDRVLDIAFDGNGTLVSASRDGGVRLWDPRRRALLREPVPGGGEGAPLVAVAADGSAAASWLGSATVWRLPGGAPVGGPVPTKADVLAVATGGSCVATGTREGDINTCDPMTPAELVTWRAHDDSIQALKFDASGEFLASGSATGEIRLWRRGRSERLAAVRPEGNGITALAFDREGKRLAAANGGTIRILAAPTLVVLATLRGSGGNVSALAFSPDGSRLASVARDRKLRLWDPDAGRELAVLLDRQDAGWTVAWSPDGSMLAAGGGFWRVSGVVVVLETPLDR